MTAEVGDYPLDDVDVFIVNETEAGELTGETKAGPMCHGLQQRFPAARGVLTLGEEGAVYFEADRSVRQPAVPTEAVDTTAAGDTFIGFFLAEWLQSNDPVRALEWGCRAAAHCVSRAGASDSIPRRSELEPV